MRPVLENGGEFTELAEPSSRTFNWTLELDQGTNRHAGVTNVALASIYSQEEL